MLLALGCFCFRNLDANLKKSKSDENHQPNRRRPSAKCLPRRISLRSLPRHVRHHLPAEIGGQHIPLKAGLSCQPVWSGAWLSFSHKKTATKGGFFPSADSCELTALDIALRFARVKLARTADFVRAAVHFQPVADPANCACKRKDHSKHFCRDTNRFKDDA